MNNLIPALRSTSYSHIQTVSAGGNLSIPVKPSQYIYSQFSYVRGVPSKSVENTVSITKIKILDTLISQLVKMKQQPSPAPATEMRQDNRQTDALIAQYKKQIDTVSATASDIPYMAQTVAALAPQNGALFSLSV